VVICLERDADLHMAQLMLLPLTLYRLNWVVPEKGHLNGCVRQIRVCIYLILAPFNFRVVFGS